jgi:hypothetical protein
MRCYDNKIIDENGKSDFEISMIDGTLDAKYYNHEPHF